MIIEFLGKWLGGYCLVMLVMCIDNICWISSSPEYEEFKKYSIYEKAKYIWGYRIKTVLTNIRDIIPAAIGGLIAGVAL